MFRPDPDGPKLGVSHPRPTGLLKACGAAAFTADIRLQEAVELAVVRAPIPHAVIKSIDFSEAEKMPGIVGFMTGKDIRGTNRLKYIVSDRPVLCEDRVRCIGDPVAVVAAGSRAQALAAAEQVKVEYEPLPAYLLPREAMAEGAARIHADRPNLCYSQPQIRGDAEEALARSAAVVEAEFSTQINHQAPLEPEASIAYLEGEEEDPVLVVIGRSINIHLHMATLQQALGWENIRYEEAFSGGQFGIKLEIMTEGIAGAAALHFKRPIRYVPSLAESMQMTSKRHPLQMKVRLGADAGGRLTAYTMDFIVDNGAYQSIGNVVLNRVLYMLSGSYNIPNIRALGKLVYTNNPWGSAARGAGPPQGNFALECAIEMLADKMAIDPLTFRSMNSLMPGQSKSTGTVVSEWPFPELCEKIRPHYERARKAAKSFKNGSVRRGVGLATGAFGIGMPGDSAMAAVEMDPDDGVTIYAAVADPGEGNDSMLVQLAAHALDLPMDKVRLVLRDTDRTTATGPAAGSRVTYMVGGALMDAIEQLKRAMAETEASSCAELTAAGRPTRYMGTRKALESGPLDPKTGQGPSFESQVHAVQLAEVEVDTATGEVKILKMTTAVDAGPVINPQNLEGQIEGGMDMGAGYALREEYIAGWTKDWVTFKFPTMKTAFDMEVILQETPRARGPLGRTGVGEMTLVPTAPAIVNAIKDACGAWLCHLPATPEKVKAAVAARA